MLITEVEILIRLALAAVLGLIGWQAAESVTGSAPFGVISKAEARVGRPLTPVSVAGATRRTGRSALPHRSRRRLEPRLPHQSHLHRARHAAARRAFRAGRRRHARRRHGPGTRPSAAWGRGAACRAAGGTPAVRVRQLAARWRRTAAGSRTRRRRDFPEVGQYHAIFIADYFTHAGHPGSNVLFGGVQ